MNVETCTLYFAGTARGPEKDRMSTQAYYKERLGFDPADTVAEHQREQRSQHGYEESLSKFKDERDAIQKKTFTKWVNKHLKKTDKELSQKTPGPKVIFCPEKEIKKIVCSSDEEVILEKDCSMTRASLLCLVVYYIKNLTYPAAFAPILVILQKIVFPQDKFGTNLMSQKVKDTLKMMNLH